MNIAVVGATGLVGTEMLKKLEASKLPITNLLPVASARSVGKEITFRGKQIKVISMEDGIAAKPDVALFSAGGSTSKEFAPKYVEAGSLVIPPLAGNGMAMAIHSAKILSETVIGFLEGTLTRNQMEQLYQKRWNQEFSSRLFWGRQLQQYMGSRSMELGVAALTVFPGILSLIVRQTHGTYLSA